MTKLCNAFSINMLTGDAIASFKKIAPPVGEQVESYVGHQDTANLLSSILQVPVPCNRQGVTLEIGEIIWVAQYTGPRLPEGATELPAGANIQFWAVGTHPFPGKEVVRNYESMVDDLNGGHLPWLTTLLESIQHRIHYLPSPYL